MRGCGSFKCLRNRAEFWKARLMSTVTLYRPVGQIELDLIRTASWKQFPPRLDWQPIFYPVASEEYATRIAREWNTKDEANGAVGYVLRFEVAASYLSAHEVHEAGGRALTEYWIPAEDLDDFNDHLVGTIEIVSEWRGQPTARIE